SSRNWGWVRRMGRAVAEYPLGIESLRIWQGLNARIGQETGFRRSGIVYSGQSARQLAWLATVERDAAQFGRAVRRLSRAELAEQFPGARLRDTEAVM
ncbi:MAG TPA: D-amino-acid oxidase, partial [Citreicella sp.]|nr:D-amino-acid oxidase [Citreicella sp.]